MNDKKSDIGQLDEEERDSEGLVSHLVGDSASKSAVNHVPLDEDLLPEGSEAATLVEQGFPDRDPADVMSDVIGDVRHPDAP